MTQFRLSDATNIVDPRNSAWYNSGSTHNNTASTPIFFDGDVYNGAEIIGSSTQAWRRLALEFAVSTGEILYGRLVYRAGTLDTFRFTGATPDTNVDDMLINGTMGALTPFENNGSANYLYFQETDLGNGFWLLEFAAEVLSDISTVGVGPGGQGSMRLIAAGFATSATFTPVGDIELDYTKGANPIQDINGNDAVDLVDRAVTNNTVTTQVVENDYIDGDIRIVNADGSPFTISEPARYAGTYSVSQAELDLGPVAVVDTVITGDGTAAVGEVINITPPLFLADEDITIAYTATNGETVNVSDPNNPTVIPTASGAFAVTATATQGAQQTASVSNSVSVSAPALVVSLVGRQEAAFAGTLDYTRTYDLSGLSVGDWIVVAEGADSDAITRLRVNGNTATVLTDNGTAARNGSHARAWAYQLQAGDNIASAALRFDNNGSGSDLSYSTLTTVWSVETSADVDITADSDYSHDGDTTAAGTVTVSNSLNTVLGWAAGRDDHMNGMSYTNVTIQGSNRTTAYDRQQSWGRVDNVATGSRTVTANFPGAASPDEAGMCAIQISWKAL